MFGYVVPGIFYLNVQYVSVLVCTIVHPPAYHCAPSYTILWKHVWDTENSNVCVYYVQNNFNESVLKVVG